MTHNYRFFMTSEIPTAPMQSQHHDVRTEVIISYTSENIQSNSALEKIARVLITQTIISWLTGIGESLDEYVSLNVLRSHLLAENLVELADWVGSFNDLSMSNLDSTEWTCVWIIFT